MTTNPDYTRVGHPGDPRNNTHGHLYVDARWGCAALRIPSRDRSPGLCTELDEVLFYAWPDEDFEKYDGSQDRRVSSARVKALQFLADACNGGDVAASLMGLLYDTHRVLIRRGYEMQRLTGENHRLREAIKACAKSLEVADV